jgi:hypothetical protein
MQNSDKLTSLIKQASLAINMPKPTDVSVIGSVRRNRDGFFMI